MKNKGFEISKDSVENFFPKTDIPILGYESPIELYIGQMRMEQENNVYKAIQEYGVNVDKDELIKALQYDRGQYEKGYVNGYNTGYTTDKWISVEDRLPSKDEYLTHHNDGIDTLRRLTIAYMTDTISYTIGCYDGYKWVNQLGNRIIKDVIAWKPFETYTPLKDSENKE